MAATLLTSVGFVYFSLLTLVSAKTATFPKKNFSSLPMPFAYKVWERPLSLSEKAKVCITKYVAALVCMSFGLSWVPLWVLTGGGPIDVLLVTNWSMMWLCSGYLAYILAWERFYTFDEPVSKWLSINDFYREKERQQKQLARAQESERLETERRERERRKQWAYAELEKLGLAEVLHEPESPMSTYYVTEMFTEYGDPLAHFRDIFAPLANADLQSLLKQHGVVRHDPAKTIDVEVSSAADKTKSDQLELPPPATPAQPKLRLKALAKAREQAASSVSEAVPVSLPEPTTVEGPGAAYIWHELQTTWREVIDSPAARVHGVVTPAEGRYAPEQLALPEALLDVTLGGRPAGLKGWRYKGSTVNGMLLMDLETAALYPELRAWLKKPANRDRLLDLDTAREDLASLASDITVGYVMRGDGPLGGWRPPSLALEESRWRISLGYVPAGEATTSRGVKESLWKVSLPVEW